MKSEGKLHERNEQREERRNKTRQGVGKQTSSRNAGKKIACVDFLFLRLHGGSIDIKEVQVHTVGFRG